MSKKILTNSVFPSAQRAISASVLYDLVKLMKNDMPTIDSTNTSPVNSKSGKNVIDLFEHGLRTKMGPNPNPFNHR